jgi:hypothetical protein
MANMLEQAPAPYQFEGLPISPGRLRASWNSLHQALAACGISSGSDLLNWLRSQHHACQGIGGYFQAEAQDALWDLVAVQDGSVLLLESTFVAVALHLWRDLPLRLSIQGSVPRRLNASEAGQSTARPAPLTSGRPPPVAPMPDAWAQLDAVDLQQELLISIRTTKGVPHCIRGPFHRILTQSLVAVERAHSQAGTSSDGDVQCIRAWKLFLLLPRMLLHVARRGGEAGERELRKRIVQFDGGNWFELLVEAHRQSVVTAAPTR